VENWSTNYGHGDGGKVFYGVKGKKPYVMKPRCILNILVFKVLFGKTQTPEPSHSLMAGTVRHLCYRPTLSLFSLVRRYIN